MLPPSVEYIQVADASSPRTFTKPSDVTPSISFPTSPSVVSSSSATVGAAGARVSTACTDWVAAILPFPAVSVATLALTSTVTLPSKPAVGVTTSVYSFALTIVNAPFVPLATVISAASKPVTSSEKVKV